MSSVTQHPTNTPEKPAAGIDNQTAPANQNAPEDQNAPERSSPLLWFREGVAGLISLVILALAALMMYGTYSYAAKELPANADPQAIAARKDNYDRQKDIMLYALALLGTVTGYYLGRVPAELHAQQAQKTANTAQAQLQKTQEKLTDTAGNAATAAKEVAVAKDEKNAAEVQKEKAVGALVTAKEAISKTLSQQSGPVSKTLSVAGESVPGLAVDVEALRSAEQEIEITLREISGRRM